MTEENEEKSERDPFKEATPRQALMAVAVIFVLGLIIGFVLGRTL